MLTRNELVTILRKECLKTSQVKWAKKHRYSQSYVNLVCNARVDMPERMMNALGYKTVCVPIK